MRTEDSVDGRPEEADAQSIRLAEARSRVADRIGERVRGASRGLGVGHRQFARYGRDGLVRLSSNAGCRRGQTAVDYAVGIATFLLVIAFVFSFVPSIMGPFTGEPTDRPLIADRSADHLSNELLVAEAGSIELDEFCTEAFFQANDVPGECRYDANGSDLPTALAVERPGVSMNVTVSDGDGNVKTLNGTELAAGDTPTASSSVASARRVVLLDDERGYVQVRVW